MKIRNFEKLIEAAGGEVQLAAKLELHQMTVEAWRKRRSGIPHKHWSKIIALLKVSPDELHAINNELYNRR